MPAIKASATGRIGDENYTGVITKAVLDALNGLFLTGTIAASLKPTHIALGSGTATATKYDTALEHEIARYPLTQLTQATNVTTALVNLPVSGADIEAAEFGVFAGDIMLARANVAISKNSNSILNLLWMLTIQEV